MNNDLYSELENLKMTDNKIIHYSKDIVQSTKELKKILDSIQVGILIIDKTSNKIIDANKAASKLFGLGKYELIGTPVDEHFVSADNNKKHFTDNNSEELLLKKSDGTLIPIIKTDAFFDASNEQYIIESFIDISERKKMEEALKLAHHELESRVEERTLDLFIAKQQAEKSDRIKSSLLANMSHEIRTPLIGIIGYSQILMNEIHEADLIGLANDIYSSGNRLLNTLNNVLYLSHIENISIELELDRVNVVEELELCISEYKKFALEKEISLEMKINKRDIYVKAEKDLFNHAVGSIIDNALKFTAKGAVNIIVDITPHNGKNWAVIKVQDTGIGISQEDQGKIFEAFRQVSEGYSRNYEGCGLGLTIAQKILDIFRGEITIESEPAKGTTFSIWLPLIS
jgi:PAS domain S-box-containing protein